MFEAGHHFCFAQDGLVPRMLSDPDASSDVSGPSEEILDRLAQTEQLVVQLKELIREKDGQLALTAKLHKVRNNVCVGTIWKTLIAVRTSSYIIHQF